MRKKYELTQKCDKSIYHLKTSWQTWDLTLSFATATNPGPESH